MNINHYKIVREKDGYSLVIYLDPQLEEFSAELGESVKERRHLKQQIQDLVKNKFPKLKIKTAKVMVGSILITSISLSPSIFNNRAEAATYTTNASYQIE